MRRLITALVTVGMFAAGPVMAASTTVGSGASAGTAVSATSGPGGFASVNTFGLAESTTMVNPHTAVTHSMDITRASGVAVGSASFSGLVSAHAWSAGASFSGLH